MNEKQLVGKRGEYIAEDSYRNRGYTLIARNVRLQAGEIDRIFKKESTFYFVEVKTRRSMAFGMPEEAITRQKASRMWRCVGEYAALHCIGIGNCVMEVCSVGLGSGSPRITLYTMN